MSMTSDCAPAAGHAAADGWLPRNMSGGGMVGAPALTDGRPDMAGAAKVPARVCQPAPPARTTMTSAGGAASLTCPADGRSADGCLAHLWPATTLKN
jgi:hypothetical protein